MVCQSGSVGIGCCMQYASEEAGDIAAVCTLNAVSVAESVMEGMKHQRTQYKRACFDLHLHPAQF